MRCAYLGCHRKGIFFDDVETSPGVIKKKLVCKKHLGKLTTNITLTGKVKSPCRVSKESDTRKEKQVARERLKEAHKRVKYDNKFFVFPDDGKKKMIITASKPGRTLKIGIKEALILADVIRRQIREWK